MVNRDLDQCLPHQRRHPQHTTEDLSTDLICASATFSQLYADFTDPGVIPDELSEVIENF